LKTGQPQYKPEEAILSAIFDGPDGLVKTEEAKRRYLRSPKGKASVKKYKDSDKGRDAQQKFAQSSKFKQSQRKYYYSPKGQEAHRRAAQKKKEESMAVDPKVTRQKYYASPKGQAARKRAYEKRKVLISGPANYTRIKTRIVCPVCGDDILSGVFIVRAPDTNIMIGLRAFCCKCGKDLEVNK